MRWYLWFKLVHIIAAIAAVGANVTYFVWLRRIRTAGPQRAFVLEGIQSLDSRVANPAYVVLPITGIAMVLLGDLGFSTLWIAAAIGLFVVLGGFAGMAFTPALKRQIEVAQATGHDPADYEAAQRRTIVTGIITMLLVFVILYLMVMKPT